jgi:hypothetical protein
MDIINILFGFGFIYFVFGAMVCIIFLGELCNDPKYILNKLKTLSTFGKIIMFLLVVLFLPMLLPCYIIYIVAVMLCLIGSIISSKMYKKDDTN